MHWVVKGLQALAGLQATVDHDFCVLVDRFDASGALAYFDGMQVDGPRWRGPVR